MNETENDLYNRMLLHWKRSRAAHISIAAQSAQFFDTQFQDIKDGVTGKELLLLRLFMDINVQAIRVSAIVEDYRIAVTLLATLTKIENIDQITMGKIAEKFENLVEIECHKESEMAINEFTELTSRGSTLLFNNEP